MCHSYITRSNQCSSLFQTLLDTQSRYEINECFILLETPFLIKEKKVLMFKVKVDIIVLLQHFLVKEFSLSLNCEFWYQLIIH
jgi:hypothetical protein